MRLIDANALIKRIDTLKHQIAGRAAGFVAEDSYECGAVDALCDAKMYAEEAPTIGGWISVKERLPVETHSIFFPWYGKQKWSSAMWKEQSDKVIVTVAFKDGTRLVTTGETHDGVWHTSISRTLEPEVTHWMPLPEPPKEET